MNPQTRVNGSSAAPQRTKLQLLTNVPAFVVLEFDPPAQSREGRFGDQFMYWLTDKATGEQVTLFADPPLHEQIVANHAHAGDTIVITKAERRQGTRKWIEWEVTRESIQRGAAQQQQQPGGWDTPRSMARAEGPSSAVAEAPRAAAARIAAPVAHTGNAMADALTQAIEACQLSGFEARTEDIRALAITIYIQTTGGRK